MPKTDKKVKSKKKVQKDPLTECQEKMEEYKAGWLRAKADYANLQKRTATSSSEAIKFANAGLILGLLPAVDNFSSAYGTLPTELESDDWVKGIGFIKQQLEKFLEDNRVKVIKAVGEKFDPNFHEAVEEVAAKEKKGTIVEEILRGYEMDGKVIRASKVKVSK
ncbi:MAG: nucleotide exchange factor GrpE [Parcubacteria group bacterium]|nr:nucleotide exchange factor GrpE [Parcubacteria group bacterium]